MQLSHAVMLPVRSFWGLWQSNILANARAVVNLPTPIGPWNNHAWWARSPARAAERISMGLSCPSIDCIT